ncbi:MAG: DUF3160 domain-containing protein [Sedimentisphaerales bacterium]|nr:DUF3160 domain-containing protein [Sedimentisphaerales bacterium]
MDTRARMMIVVLGLGLAMAVLMVGGADCGTDEGNNGGDTPAAAAISGGGGNSGAVISDGAAAWRWSLEQLPGAADFGERLAGYYQPVEVEVDAQAQGYELPLDWQRVNNPEVLEQMFSQQNAERITELIRRNGFAVAAAGTCDDVKEFYEQCQEMGVPIFVTSDSLLHLYHIQFDETLREIEERIFVDDIRTISEAIQRRAMQLYETTQGDAQEAARLLVGYTAVANRLLWSVDYREEAETLLEDLQGQQRVNMGVLMSLNEDFRIQLEQWAGGIDQLMGRDGADELRQILRDYLQQIPSEEDLLEEHVPEMVREDVAAELTMIAEHEGFGASALFGYDEDYSQYVPRGHYTRSRVLQQYFKAMMWYGRMTFLAPDEDAPDAQRRRIQTMAAAMLAGMMEQQIGDMQPGDRAVDVRTVADVWDRVYVVTAYYVGLADDLTPYEYRSALREVFDGEMTVADLTAPGNLEALGAVLARMRMPAIYSGLGNTAAGPASESDEGDLEATLTATQGLRLMGQRYVPDSYIMGRLVYPTIGEYGGEGAVFTMAATDGGMIRAFPRGLDVWAVLGSDRAWHWLRELGDDVYENYYAKMTELQEEFSTISQADWNRNMYWSWLYALQGLLQDYGQGYPRFMQTNAWRDKQMSAVLASWAQLRHDTILYAKQSYTMRATGMPMPGRMVEGYVEPVPEFYARLLALTRMTIAGLDDMGCLIDEARQRLARLETIVERLIDISQRELANEMLSEDDYAFIRHFGDALSGAVAGLEEGMETTIVADVHTDTNSGQVLEEGTGYLHPMVVVYAMPDGGLVAGVGPVLSHYEFKQPMGDRLTDEAWRLMLESGTGPDLPEWVWGFTVGGVSPPSIPH